MISSHPERILVRYKRRLTKVTVIKKNIPLMKRISNRGTMNVLILLIAVSGDSTSGELFHIQNSRPSIKKTLVKMVVINVDRIISTLSGTSSLTVVHRP